jgi:glycosyltransferase involved in cell wall biosynthesis
MSQYKICVYAICKNEEKFVSRWMDSMLEADLVVVTDTGSEDGTVEQLRKRGAQVFVEAVIPWRFDVARNRSLAHVPEDVDICVCTDLDEVLEPGWRQCIERVWTKQTTLGKYLYNWSLKEDGTPDVQFQYSKVHARHGFQWYYPVHEWLSYVGTLPEETVFIEGMVLNHFPDNAKSRGSYLPLLELAAQEMPQDSRVTYYLGREYMYKEEWQSCIQTLKKHLSLPTSTWEEERCASMRWIAKSYYQMKAYQEAYAWYYRAIAERPDMRDAYVEFAQMAYLLSDWYTVFYMVEEALKIKERSKEYINMGYAWDATPYDLGAIACFWHNMLDRALAYANTALAMSPQDERLQNNLRLIEEAIAHAHPD